MRGLLKTFLAASILVASGLPAFAGTIEVEDARAEMMEGQAERGDIFMKIVNGGSTADRLYAVRTKAAKKASLETESEADVIAGKSSESTSLLIKPGQTVELTEEGAHIELFDLSKPFAEGETFTATLFFERAGPVKVTVTVGEE